MMDNGREIVAQPAKRRTRAAATEADSKQQQQPTATKRRRVIISDSEEEEEEKNGADIKSLPVEDEDDVDMEETKALSTSTPARTKITGKKTARTPSTTTAPLTPSGAGKSSEMSRSFLASFRANEVCLKRLMRRLFDCILYIFNYHQIQE